MLCVSPAPPPPPPLFFFVLLAPLAHPSQVLGDISAELEERCAELLAAGKTLEAGRLRQRTESDLVLLRLVDTCKGVENYSRHLARRGKCFCFTRGAEGGMMTTRFALQIKLLHRIFCLLPWQ